MSERNKGKVPEQRSNIASEAEGMECDYRSGVMPRCMPLAMAYVPVQQESTPQYNKSDALSRGTLFPGLDLPWKNIVNKSEAANTPLGELMALGFVINELNLYLDTHPEDTEALEMFVKYNRLYAEGQEIYVKKFGPITLSDVGDDAFTWINGPWPWEYVERKV